MSITLNGTTGIIADNPATVKAKNLASKLFLI